MTLTEEQKAEIRARAYGRNKLNQASKDRRALLAHIAEQDAALAAAEKRAEDAEAQRDDLRWAIAPDADETLTNGQYVEMALTTEGARCGALARAETAEAERDSLRAEVERLREALTSALLPSSPSRQKGPRAMDRDELIRPLPSLPEGGE